MKSKSSTPPSTVTPLLLFFSLVVVLASSTASAASLWPRPSKMVRVIAARLLPACVERENRTEEHGRRASMNEADLSTTNLKKKNRPRPERPSSSTALPSASPSPAPTRTCCTGPLTATTG